MFCSSCGNQIPDDVRFCAGCGAPVPPPPAAELPTPIPPPPAGFPASAPPPPTHVASGSGSFGSYGTPTPPGKRSRLGLWIGIAIAAVIIIAAAIAVPLLLLGRDDSSTSSTTENQATSTTSSGTTDTQTTSSSASTSTTAVAGAPGDSPGEWVELDNSALPTGAYTVAISDQALIVYAREDDDTSRFVAYMLDSGDLIELPVDAAESYGADIDGLLAVWWEGTYDEDTGDTTDEHIYAYRLPDGPKTELAGGGEWLNYPQVAGRWVTWVSGEPLESNPDEYWHLQISGVAVDANGRPQGDPTVLVPSATAFAMGDSTWVYSLSETRLAWEQATALGTLDPGTYTMDLNGTLQPVRLGSEVWRPSLGGGSVVYYEDGLKATNLATGAAQEIDPLGDFATAGPTYAAYFRTIESADEWSYEIVARGFTGSYEQVLGEQYDAPWMSPFIGASAHHVAFIVDGVVHVFEWQGQGR